MRVDVQDYLQGSPCSPLAHSKLPCLQLPLPILHPQPVGRQEISADPVRVAAPVLPEDVPMSRVEGGGEEFQRIAKGNNVGVQPDHLFEAGEDDGKGLDLEPAEGEGGGDVGEVIDVIAHHSHPLKELHDLGRHLALVSIEEFHRKRAPDPPQHPQRHIRVCHLNSPPCCHHHSSPLEHLRILALLRQDRADRRDMLSLAGWCGRHELLPLLALL
mmetsp:Transcript_31513/g.100829  ORF Transcript_31513/g.100829 Transcript_31513/m.100829 type:complete len:215 (+) Transcript_31513:416-1060(+)